MQRIHRVLVGVALLASLVACGGGGGGGTSSNPSPPPQPQPQPLTVTFDSSVVSLAVTPVEPDAERTLNVRFGGDVPDVLYIGMQTTFNGLALVNLLGTTLDDTQIHLRFRSAGAAPNGTYTDTVALIVCYDAACEKPVPGSPFDVAISCTVTGSPVVGAPPAALPTLPADRLGHDVIDAQISKPLNAIVMVSSYPGNALYLYDLATRTERTLPLGRVPAALSLSPDGLKAAVGHDALISHVDLAVMAQGGAITPTLLNVPVPIYGLVLDGHGKVHVFPSANQWVDLHTVDVATNTDVSQYAWLYAKTNARLDPDGDAIYMLDTLLSPQNLKKFSVSTGVPQHLYDAPYWGDHPMCGKLWFSEDGGTIFTGCGNTFQASATQSLDMIYRGQLPLTDSTGTYYASIVSASHSSARNEIAILDAGKCGSAGAPECDTVLRLIDSDLYNPTASFWMKPVPLDTDSRFHSQHGMFVFHGLNGDKWVISRLAGVAEPGGRFYLANLVPATPTH
jgi:hypothetical protein